MDVTTSPAAQGRAAVPEDERAVPRRRDAAATRQLLLTAARHRFARQGYAATTVREIADDAGVNVALISRYFASKEGLFEACLTRASAELGASVAPGATLDDVAAAMAAQIAGPYTAERPNQVVLLLRTSGDERAEQIRLDTLRTYSERLAGIAGGPAVGQGAEELLLRAQLALSAALGIAVVRSWTLMEPLASVAEADLVGPVQALIHALLAPGATSSS